jgi:hypothetical protein
VPWITLRLDVDTIPIGAIAQSSAMKPFRRQVRDPRERMRGKNRGED